MTTVEVERAELDRELTAMARAGFGLTGGPPAGLI